jgi:hypothetical protein
VLGISLSVVSSRRIIRRIGLALVGLIVALLSLAGAIYQAVATKRAERAYPPPGEMVDVGGYSLHINCVGQGTRPCPAETIHEGRLKEAKAAARLRRRWLTLPFRP